MTIDLAFKKGVGCSQAVYSARNIVTRLVNRGSTVILCALDIYKIFHKVNHHAFYIKLMKLRLPRLQVKLVDLLVYWLDHCSSCIKWCGVLSEFLKLSI